MAVVGSGIAAQRLSPDDVGLQLLENSLVTGAVLVALILALQPVSASFNPVVTLVERALGLIGTRDGGVTLVGAQSSAACSARSLANLMFDLDAVSFSTHERSGAGIWLGEVVATHRPGAGRLRLPAQRPSETVAFAVGGYITAAYWFTSSTSFANPAVTVARMLSDTFAGIAPASVPMFVLMQLVGGVLALGLVRFLFADPIAGGGRDERPTVLFVCVHNAGRSQMAAGFLQHLAGDRVDVLSAGSQPADGINPVAVEAMAEVGIDITAAQPKVLTPDAVQASDVVVTMGCGDECPFFPGKRYEDWVLDDPAGQGLEAVRPIRDEIRRRVELLVAELVES